MNALARRICLTNEQLQVSNKPGLDDPLEVRND